MTHPYQPSEEILRLAREAGFGYWPDGIRDNGEPSVYLDCWPEQLERFAMLVEQRAKADERERCAIVCDNVASDPGGDKATRFVADRLAAAIRSSAPRSTGGEE